MNVNKLKLNRASSAVFIFVFVTLCFWLSGLNFDHRGVDIAIWFLFSGVAAGVVYYFP